MLARQGIITSAEGDALVKGLAQVARELESGALALDPALEDVHTNVERRLAEIAGPVAGKLHTGRSRNDQIATDFMLWMREAIGDVRRSLAELRGALVERAGREVEVVLPGYTHLQRAQPVRLAHHWLAHYEALARDAGRLADARARMSRSPLGAGALAGSTLPIDRESTARELGFDGPTRNSLDSGLGARRRARAPGGARDPDGPPVAALRGARAVELVGVRLRRARRRVLDRLEPDAAEEEPRRRGARAREVRAAWSAIWSACW